MNGIIHPGAALIVPIAALMFLPAGRSAETGLQKMDANNSGLSRTNGVLFLDGTSFSGVLTESYAGGKLKSRTEYRNGKEDGSSDSWYEDGTRRSERYYRNGKKVGEHKGWWPNGRLQFNFHFRDGLAEGESVQWYESGQIAQKQHYENGVESGLQQAWRENGALYVNYVVKDGRQFGMVKARLCNQVKGN